MTFRFATDDEIATWDEHILNNPDTGEFFQTTEFGNVKKLTDWQPRYIVAGSTYLVALEKSLPLLGKLWYLQKAPAAVSLDALQPLLEELRSFAREQGLFCVKVEPPVERTSEAMSVIEACKLVPGRRVQATYSTIWLDISPDIDAVLAGFNGKTRYNIRQAVKAGVTCKEVEATDENCREFYRLFQETADSRFPIRAFEYYRAFWQGFCNTGHGKLFFAFVDDVLISADFVMILGKKASRKDAASERQKSVRGAAALLELEVIKQLKSQGITHYDLCGTPASDQLKNTNDTLYGVGQFKAGFSPVVTDYIGAYDLIVKPSAYRIWTALGERLAQRWRHRKYHENWY